MGYDFIDPSHADATIVQRLAPITGMRFPGVKGCSESLLKSQGTGSATGALVSKGFVPFVGSHASEMEAWVSFDCYQNPESSLTRQKRKRKLTENGADRGRKKAKKIPSASYKVIFDASNSHPQRRSVGSPTIRPGLNGGRIG